jgi:hypothetical protein
LCGFLFGDTQPLHPFGGGTVSGLPETFTGCGSTNLSGAHLLQDD